MSDYDVQRASEAMEGTGTICSIFFRIYFTYSLVAYQISKLLNTGLDRSTLGILINLVEEGVNPEALAAVVKELRRESAPPNKVRFCLA